MLKFYISRIRFVIFLAVVSAFLSWAAPAGAEGRDPSWARPLEVEGLPSLYKVTENLYRSAQPDAEGFRNAEELGITTVLNLRGLHSDDELAEGTGLRLARVRINTWSMDEEEILAALRVISEAKGPVLVHCMHGADRTGTVMAAYRMVVQGWPRESAIAEMTEGGYGFHSTWGNLIILLENLDVESLRAQLNGTNSL